MAVTFDASVILSSVALGSTDIVFGVTTFTSANFTIGSGANRAAIVFVFTSDPAAVISSVTLGGVSGALVTGADTGNVASATGRVRAYAVINPPSGSQTATATISSAACNMGVAVITVAGADQTAPGQNGNKFQANSSPAATSSVAVTSANGNLTTTAAFSSNAWGSTGSGTGTITNQTLITLGPSNAWGFDRGPGTGTTTHTWSDQFSGQEHDIAGVDIKAAAGGAAPFVSTLEDLPPTSVGTAFNYPQSLRTHLQTYTALIYNLSIMYGVLGEVIAYDWPLPRAKTYPNDLRTFTDSFTLGLIGKDQFFAAPGMGPSYDYPNPRPKSYQTDLRGYTFNGTLYLPEPSVPSLTDWPLPMVAKYPLDLRTFINPVEIQLIGLDKLYGAPGQVLTYDWPLPVPERYDVSLRTYVQGLSELLLTSLNPVPFNTYDWPNPQRVNPYPNSLRTWISYYVVDTSAPFAISDWPLPSWKAYSIDLRTAISSSQTVLSGGDKIYGANGQVPSYDWPLPSRKFYPLDLASYLQSANEGLLTAMNPIPLSVFDWPNPVWRSYPITLRTHLAWAKLQETTPFAMTDYPNPLGKFYPGDLRSALPYNFGLLTSIPALEPFYLTDWPLPVQKVYAPDLRTFLNPIELQLIGQDTFFGPAGMGPTYDYPNPRPKAYANDLRTFTQSQQIGLTGLTPFSLTEWPNPTWKAYPTSLRTLTTWRALGSVDAPPPAATSEFELGLLHTQTVSSRFQLGN